MCTVFPTNKITIYTQSSPTTSTVRAQSTQTKCVGANIRAQFSQAKCVGAVPMCPPERPSSDVSIPKIHALCAGNLTTDAPLWGDTGGHIGTAPTNLHHIFPRNPTQIKFRPCAIHPKRNQPPMCNPSLPISIKPCGVPLPHRGYTFDSAGLASATQPTLGNDASEGTTHNVGCTFFRHTLTMLPHNNTHTQHIGGGNASRTPAPIT